jgi:hypothetical protein
MQAKRISDEDIVRRLNEHPELRERVAALLLVVQDEAGDLKRADAAEQRLTQELRRMGQDAMQAWAQQQVHRTEQELRAGGRAHREGKKNSAGTPPSATSA